jgi:FkbM family methyltransferase
LIDAGANVGHISLLLSDLVGGHAGIFAFEPAPGAFRRLCENWRLNGWPVDQLFEFALGSHAGSVFLDKRDDPLTTIGVWPERSDLNPFEVRMIRLDDMSAVWATRRVGVLKVDVEASEPEVLQGAHRLLKEHRVRTVMFESMEKGLDPAIAALLEDCGYCVFGLTGEGEPDFSRMDAQNLFAVPNESRGDLHT